MLFLLNLLRAHFIKTKYKFNLEDLVQVHHIIPLEHRYHPNLDNYDINAGYNLMLMPTKKGKQLINTTRRIHEGGHQKYNKHVKHYLDLNCDPYEISYILRLQLMNDEDIPW